MSGLGFRSERAKTAAVVGVTFLVVPLLVFALLVGVGGGFVIALLMAEAQWLIWLAPAFGVLFLARAVIDEARARRKKDQ